MTEKRIVTPRGNVYYWISGEENRPAIFFAHGLTADHRLFRKQMSYFEREYRVIAWDMPLHGKSRPHHDFSLENAARDMLTILQVEGIEKAVLVGQSAGGYVCQRFIRDYPQKVLGFVGVGTSPLDPSYYNRREMVLLRGFSAVASWYPYSVYCKASAKAVATTRDARRSFYETLVDLGKEGMLKATREMYDALLEGFCKVKMYCPVMLVMGEEDRAGDVPRYNYEWAAKESIPLKIIPHGGHNVNDDDAAMFNGLLQAFIRHRIKGRATNEPYHAKGSEA